VFELVTELNLRTAARIHAEAWRESHRTFCYPAFVEAHTTERQMAYIRKEQARGRAFYLLVLDSPKGIVSVSGSLIENLYVLPGEQRKGYGTMLLRHAERLCAGVPTLWVLSNNAAAQALYRGEGYVLTGRRRDLKDDLGELEMVKQMESAAP
jgi:GNAT superfamily N-acetyltransferase